MGIKLKIRSASLCIGIEGVCVFLNRATGKVLCGKSDSNGNLMLKDTVVDDTELLLFEHSDFEILETTLKEARTVVRLLEKYLIGYQDRLDYDPGTTSTVFVHSRSRFHAKLMRHGLRRTMVKDLGCHERMTQKVPCSHFVDTGLNWNPSFTYQIPKDTKSGLYSLLIENESGERFAMPMVVNANQSESKTRVLVLASNTTWQSYNLWGGRSRYRNYENNEEIKPKQKSSFFRLLVRICSILLPLWLKKLILSRRQFKEPSLPWKFKPLSILRPFTNCDLDHECVFEPFTNHLAGGEWRLLAWLEREKIDYAFVSGTKLHHDPSILNNRDVLMLSTHCEYWTEQMYQSVQSAHEQNGLWIVNASGNSIYREIEFVDQCSTRCISLSFAESCADETQLIGVRFTNIDYATCAAYKIMEPTHWVFDGIPLNDNYSKFGEKSLNQNTNFQTQLYDPGRPGQDNALIGCGASGWEMDKLSNTAPDDFVIVACGENRNGGAEMVVREPQKNRGGVFSASSLTFSGSLLIDFVCSELMKRVLGKATNIDNK